MQTLTAFLFQGAGGDLVTNGLKSIQHARKGRKEHAKKQHVSSDEICGIGYNYYLPVELQATGPPSH